MIRKICTYALLSLCVVVGSCSSEDESPSHSFRIYEENGITVAETTGGPKYEGELFDYEEIVRLEQDESREETILYGTFAFAVGDDGNSYVVDRGNGRIAVFGFDGKYLRSFGREGDGPGEFRFPALLWLRDNKMAIFDYKNRRTSIFNTDGTFLDSFSFLSGAFMSGLYPVSQGRMVVLDDKMTVHPDQSVKITPIATVISAEGDTLNQVMAPTYYMMQFISLRDLEGGGRIQQHMYFKTISGTIFSPEQGILIFTNAEPLFKWYGLDGELSHIVRIELDPEPVQPEERQAILRQYDEGIESAVNERQKASYKAWKKFAVIPDTKSFWMTTEIDDMGYYWLLCHPDYVGVAAGTESPRYRVLCPNGEYLGFTTPLVDGSISRGHLLAVIEDERTGEVAFVVYRIIPAIDGLKYP